MGVLSCFLSVVECPHLADRATRDKGLREELARYFGPRALDATGYVEKDWSTDPGSTGCITPRTPGLLTAAGEHLRKPSGRIHWAGTESAKRWCGYMDGFLPIEPRRQHAGIKDPWGRPNEPLYSRMCELYPQVYELADQR